MPQRIEERLDAYLKKYPGARPSGANACVPQEWLEEEAQIRHEVKTVLPSCSPQGVLACTEALKLYGVPIDESLCVAAIEACGDDAAMASKMSQLVDIRTPEVNAAVQAAELRAQVASASGASASARVASKSDAMALPSNVPILEELDSKIQRFIQQKFGADSDLTQKATQKQRADKMHLQMIIRADAIQAFGQIEPADVKAIVASFHQAKIPVDESFYGKAIEACKSDRNCAEEVYRSVPSAFRTLAVHQAWSKVDETAGVPSARIAKFRQECEKAPEGFDHDTWQSHLHVIVSLQALDTVKDCGPQSVLPSIQAMKNAGIKPTPDFYAGAVLSCGADFVTAKKIVEEYEGEDDGVYSAMARCYGKSPGLSNLTEVLMAAVHKGPNVSWCTEKTAQLLAGADWLTARACLQNFFDHKVPVHLRVWDGALDRCLSNGRPDKAHAIFQRMNQPGAETTGVSLSYATTLRLLSAHIANGDLERAQDVFAFICQRYPNRLGGEDFRRLAKLHAHGDALGGALAVLQATKQRGVNPPPEVFAHAINRCGSNFAMAKKIVEENEGENDRVYSAMAQCYDKTEGLSNLASVKAAAAKTRPLHSCIQDTLRVLTGADWLTARAALQSFFDCRLQPSVEIWQQAIGRCLSDGRPDKAHEIFQRMRRPEPGRPVALLPDNSTIAKLLSAHCQKADFKRAEEMLNLVPRHQLRAEHFAQLMALHISSGGGWKAVERLWQQMKRMGVCADKAIYDARAKSYQAAGLEKEANDVRLQETADMTSKPSKGMEGETGR